MTSAVGRRRIFVAALAAMSGAIGTASAADLNDVASGAWDSSATWGGSVPQSDDSVTIDQFTVTVSKTQGAAITYPITLNLGGDGTNGKLNLAYDTNVAAAASWNFTGGGTFQNNRGDMWNQGVTWNIANSTTYYTDAVSEISKVGGSGATTGTVITGSGTIVKTGPGAINVRSIANVLDADGTTAGNQTRTNASSFNGTWDIQAGIIDFDVPQFSKLATINLGGTVAGTQAGITNTTAGLDDSPQVRYSLADTYSGMQPEVKTLTGSGRIAWNNNGYYRDMAVSSLIDPGTSSSPGLIKRHTANNKNDLVMRPGSTMAFDIFGATAADADQIDWTDTVSTSGVVFDEANLKVRLFTPSGSLSGLNWVLINADEFTSKGSQGGSPSTAVANEAFANSANPIFQNLDGSPADLWDGTAGDGGWNLSVSYLGTMGNGDRQVVLSGSYIAVPEPTALGVLAIGAGSLLVRRKRSVN